MKRFACFVVLFFLGTSALYAQLGKSPKSASLEYGKPVREYQDYGYLVHVFDMDGFKRQVFYKHSSIAVMVKIISATRSDNPADHIISEASIQDLLAQNSENSKWISRDKEPIAGKKHWDREDGKAIAILDEAKALLTIAYLSYFTEKKIVDINDWAPIQVCVTESVALPPCACVYGVRGGFMCGGDRVLGAEGAAFSATTTEVYGVKGALVNVGDGSRGAHFGVVNVESDFEGMQAGVVNILSGKNPGEAAAGAFQFGLVNYARELNGCQFGLVNVIGNGALPFMLIFNFDSPSPEVESIRKSGF